MKILHVITGLQNAAGTSVFCGEVCNGLVALGHEVTIAVFNPQATDCYPLDSRIKLVSISSLLHDYIITSPSQSIIHINALWAPILHKVVKWARQNNLPIVWSPHGMLTRWAMHNKWWKKQMAWWLYQKRDLSYANLIHVTAQSEVEDISRMGLSNKVIIAPLGVKIDNRVGHVERVDGKKVLLFVSRVHKKKGLMNLVQAWSQLPSEIKGGWIIRIVGPDQDNHTDELKKLCTELDVEKDFEFVGPKYGVELTREYESADLFVLPTHSENFGSVVIEALAHKVPVICTKGAPWEELEINKCGWWIEIGVEPLMRALQCVMSIDDKTHHDMGERGYWLVKERYTWDAVVKTMMKGYEDLLCD